MGDICRYRRERSTANQLAYKYVGVEDLLSNRGGVSDQLNSMENGSHAVFLPGDILIGNIRPYLKKIWLADSEGRTNGDVLVITPKEDFERELDSEYLYFVLSSDAFFSYAVETSKGAKMPRGDKNAIMKYEIPVPSLTCQKEIAQTLTKYETFTGSLSDGLPAEIAARRQQYEYYRNKLLTFKELKAS